MNKQNARNNLPNRSWKKTAVAAAVSLAIHQSVQAQETQQQQDAEQAQTDTSGSLDEVVVSATRRMETLQKVPLNIAAIDGGLIAERGLTGLTDLLSQTPGVFLADQGRGVAGEIVARGLSLGGTAEPGFAENDAGGVVSTYVGEIPVFVDLRLTDLERVEVLLGPQGTLYGAGTLGGAIRYIPHKPRFDGRELSLRADTYGYSESDGVGTDAGFTVNVPLGERLAFRANVDYLHDPGFVDDDFLVRQAGVSDPDPDFSDPQDVAVNLRRVKDANKERTLSGHAALRWQPVDALDATLNFYFQDQEVDAATKNHLASFGTGRYESADRFLEFQNRRNRIASLEVTGDLGFAELTSATAYTKYDGQLNIDLTDLLMNLGFSYEAFPQFAAYSPWNTTQDRFTQEVRLVSKTEGPFGWIAGAFYDKRTTFTRADEFTPGYSQFVLGEFPDVWLGVPRPDNMELANTNDVDQKEKAVFGELSYQLTDAWKIIGGARWYDYHQTYAQAVDLPLFYTSYFAVDDPLHRAPDEVLLTPVVTSTKDDGILTKFSTSYQFTGDLMAYFTRSMGYRIGSTNSYPACSPELDPKVLCVSPSEAEYLPDKTVNWELGVRSQWLDHRLTVNGSLFYIDWEDPQLQGLTAQSAGITTNGEGARTRGVDLSVNAAITSRLKIAANYSYTDAELTARAVGLVRTSAGREDGLPGDRLPHSPRHQGSFHVNYARPVGQQELLLHYGITAVSDILTTVGGRGVSDTLGGYAVHSLSAAWRTDRWTLSLYADNLFNKFAITGVEKDRGFIENLADVNGAPVPVRRYQSFYLTPRQFGLRFTYDFHL
jgi:outer membrane receptor protein involved in Fe transport